MRSCRSASVAFGVGAVASLSACVDAPRRPLDPAASEQRLRARSLADPRLRDLCVERLGVAPDPWPPRELDVAQLTLAAWLFRPELEVAREQVAAAESKADRAGVPPDPSLTVSGGPVDNRGSASPWIVNVSLDLVLQTAGKRGKSVAIARQEVELARLDAAAAAWRVYGEVRDAAAARAAAARAHERAAAEVALRRRLVAQLEARVASGAASRPEMFDAQSLLDRAQSAMRRSESELLAARMRLAAACGVAVDATEFELAAPAPATDVALVAEVVDRLDVRRALADYELAERQLELELAKQYPDVKLGPGWEYDQGDRKYTIGIGVDLPLFDRNQAGIASALGRRGELAAQFDKVQADALAEIGSATRLFESASRAYAEFTGEPERRSAARAAAARVAFESGASDSLAAVAAELERNEFLRARDEALAAWTAARARLEDAVQCPLDARLAALARPRTAGDGDEATRSGRGETR